jgi:hypothetical protein
MKKLNPLALVLGFSLVGSACAADTGGVAARTEVVFDHPENFTDVKDAQFATDSGRDNILGQIRDFMVSRTSRLLPADDTLKVTFTDIDLAGDFEPWHGPQWADVRVVKALYPPAFKFSYAVTDASGKIVKEGTENIRDMNFQTRIVANNSDPLRYEKDILDDWARSTLRGLK